MVTAQIKYEKLFILFFYYIQLDLICTYNLHRLNDSKYIIIEIADLFARNLLRNHNFFSKALPKRSGF